mmetsp:Transcript_45940/g.147636  ORF Transcript_45940/g.147636 Transcript_45940/m.147636 type:complete len:294 (-) Transcript_45940:2408-3289(-)
MALPSALVLHTNEGGRPRKARFAGKALARTEPRRNSCASSTSEAAESLRSEATCSSVMSSSTSASGSSPSAALVSKRKSASSAPAASCLDEAAATGGEAPPRPARLISLSNCTLDRDNIASADALMFRSFAQEAAAPSPRSAAWASKASKALAAAKVSDHTQNSNCEATASSLLFEKGDRPPATTSKAAVSSSSPSKAPRSAARPSSGSTGSRAKTSPMGKRCGGFIPTTASIATNSSIAASTLFLLGGSGAWAKNLRGSRPKAIACKQLCARSHRCISGAGRSADASSCARE